VTDNAGLGFYRAELQESFDGSSIKTRLLTLGGIRSGRPGTHGLLRERRRDRQRRSWAALAARLSSRLPAG